MENVLTKVIYYTDWNVMIDRTKLDIEFLDAFQIKYEYNLLIGENKVGIEFICKNQ